MPVRDLLWPVAGADRITRIIIVMYLPRTNGRPYRRDRHKTQDSL